MSFNEWREYVLLDVIEKFIDYRGKTPKKTESGIPLITAKIVKDGSIQKASEFISEDDYLTWMTRGFPKFNDVVMTTEAPLGEIAQIKTQEKIALAQRIITMRGKENVLDNNFLRYFLQSDLGQSRLNEKATGTTVTGIKSSELKKVMIFMPEFKEQRAISNILSCIDEKIRINNDINETLEQMAQTIFHSWFIDFEPCQDGEFEDSDFGRIPKGWEIKSLGSEIGISTKSMNPKNEGGLTVELYSIPAYDNFKMPVFEKATEIKSNKYIVPKTCFLVSKLNPANKRIWKPYSISKNAICSTEFMVYETKKPEQIDFFYSLLNHFSFSDFLVSNATGSTNSRQRVTPSTTLKYKYAHPTDDIILKFTDVVTPIYKKIQDNVVENQKLSEVRNSLLPKLMSGEIRVPIEGISENE